MSRKRNSKVNRTNGFHGQDCWERNRVNQYETDSAPYEKERGWKNGTKEPEDFNSYAAGMLKNMNREMTRAAADIGRSIADVVTPLLAAAANLPDMDLRLENIEVHQDKHRTTFCFIHPDRDDDRNEDDYDDGHGCEDEGEEERLYDCGD